MVTQPRTSSDTCVAVLILGALPMDLAAKGLFMAAMLGFFALHSWTVLFHIGEKKSSGVICEARMFPLSVRSNAS
jgi:hypothetical protein